MDICDAAVEIASDPKDLADSVTQWLLAAMSASPGLFAIALSGGSTPRHMYESWARPPYRDQFPWGRIHWFWGDERFVPHDDPASNYGMARRAFLSAVPIATANIHRITTEGLSPEESAANYEQTLKAFYGQDHLDAARPLFDCALLGLGGNGHTASLFPGTAVLEEHARWVAPVRTDAGVRITLTFPALNSTRHMAFLVAGSDKAKVLAQLRTGDQSIPAARVGPIGDLWIFADQAANRART